MENEHAQTETEEMDIHRLHRRGFGGSGILSHGDQEIFSRRKDRKEHGLFAMNGRRIDLEILDLQRALQDLEWNGMADQASVIRDRIAFLKYKKSIGETHDYDF